MEGAGEKRPIQKYESPFRGKKISSLLAKIPSHIYAAKRGNSRLANLKYLQIIYLHRKTSKKAFCQAWKKSVYFIYKVTTKKWNTEE